MLIVHFYFVFQPAWRFGHGFIKDFKDNLPIVVMAGMVVLGHVGWKRLQSVPGVGDTENQDYPHTRVSDLQYTVWELQKFTLVHHNAFLT